MTKIELMLQSVTAPVTESGFDNAFVRATLGEDLSETESLSFGQAAEEQPEVRQAV